MNLTEVELFTAPCDVVEKTEQSLQRAGRDGYELFVLWSGVQHEREFIVRTAHVPRQTSYRRKRGLVVRVEGEALHRLNAWLYEHDETLAVQIHAHPTDAFHSETDDAFPIVTARGGLSIVAADFCSKGLLTTDTAAYRLEAEGWQPVDFGVDQLLRVI